MEPKPIEQWTVDDYRAELATVRQQRDRAFDLLRDIMIGNANFVDAVTRARRLVG